MIKHEAASPKWWRAVNVRGKEKEKMVQTYTFLDPGSNTTLCTDKLVERLVATGKKSDIVLNCHG